MIPETLFWEGCITIGLNMITETNVAASIRFTTFPKTMLLELVVVPHFQTQCCETQRVYNISKNIKYLLEHVSAGISKTHVANIIGFTTSPRNQLLEYLTFDINNVAKTNVCINMVLRNVVKPIVIAKLFGGLL